VYDFVHLFCFHTIVKSKNKAIEEETSQKAIADATNQHSDSEPLNSHEILENMSSIRSNTCDEINDQLQRNALIDNQSKSIVVDDDVVLGPSPSLSKKTNSNVSKHKNTESQSKLEIAEDDDIVLLPSLSERLARMRIGGQERGVKRNDGENFQKKNSNRRDFEEANIRDEKVVSSGNKYKNSTNRNSTITIVGEDKES